MNCKALDLIKIHYAAERMSDIHTIRQDVCHLSVEGLHSAAVDHEGLAGNPRRHGGGKEEDRLGDVGYLTEPVDRSVGEHTGLDLGRHDACQGGGAGGSGADAVDAYTHRAEVMRQVGAHMVECGFGGCVDGYAGTMVDAAHRGYVYDASVAGFLHMWSGELAETPRSEYVH